jgi:uncharacterized protein YhfF
MGLMPDDRHDILQAAFPGEAGRFFPAMSIGGTPEGADHGAALILDGTKTATSSPFSDYPDGRIPFVETTRVETVRFRDVTEAMARAYGEGERTLAWWRREIGAWYRDKAARENRAFSEEDEILWEWIAVVRRLQPGSGTP